MWSYVFFSAFLPGRCYCTSITHTITTVCDAPEEAVVYPVGALSISRMAGGITNVEVCESGIPAYVVVDGAVTSTFSLTMPQQTVNCHGKVVVYVRQTQECQYFFLYVFQYLFSYNDFTTLDTL